MKKSTLIVVVVALALGAFVYFYDSKLKTGPVSDEASWKPAFNIKSDDITQLTLESKSNKATVDFERKGSEWQITSPIQARADQTAITRIAGDLATDKIERSFVPTGNLSSYGLADPAETISFVTKSGAKHLLRLGERDFSGTLIYAMVDDSKKVGMIPISLLNESDQPVSELRDRNVLDFQTSDISGITLDDPSGKIVLARNGVDWQVTAPKKLPTDSDAVDALVNSANSTKFTQVVEENAKDLAKYGLVHPLLTLQLASKGSQMLELTVGKKIDDDYYARDASRPLVFRIPGTLYAALDKNLFDLRDKSIIKFDVSDLTGTTLRNSNGEVQLTQVKEGQWKLVMPAAEKGKTAESWKIFDPLQNARATAIYDTPTPAILAHFRKPAIVVTLDKKAGKPITVDISSASGKDVYARTSAGATVYQLSTQILKDLGFKPSELAG